VRRKPDRPGTLRSFFHLDLGNCVHHALNDQSSGHCYSNRRSGLEDSPDEDRRFGTGVLASVFDNDGQTGSYSGSYSEPEVPLEEMRSYVVLFALRSPRTPFLDSVRLHDGALGIHFVFFMRHGRTEIVVVQKLQDKPALRKGSLEQELFLTVLLDYPYVEMKIRQLRAACPAS